MANLKSQLYQAYKERALLLILLPPLTFFFVFHYIPIYGILIAFKDLQPGMTMFNCPWVGFKWFEEFFNSPYFWRSLKNTVTLSTLNLIFQFPLPIVFALAINEIRNMAYKRIAQSIRYFPHFISTVVIVGMLYNFLGVDNGIINNLLKTNGVETINFFNKPGWFRPLYIISGIWQSLGWSSIIYIAALSSADINLYEAAKIDGAKRLRQIWHISIPCITPTIVILFLLNMGNFLKIGFEKIILMYNPLTYEVADVISTYVYRVGIQSGQYSFATAIDFSNQVINFVLLIFFNKLCKKIGGESLW